MSKKSHWPLTILGGAVSLFNLFLPLVLVRILTPHEIGQYKIYFLYLAMIPWLFLTAGINNGLSHWAGHDERKISATQTSWVLSFSIAMLSLIIGLLFRKTLQTTLGWSESTTLYLIIGASLSIMANFFDDASIALGHIIRGAVFGSGFDLIRNLALVGAALYFRKIEAVFIAHLAVISIKICIGLVWGYREKFQRLITSTTSMRSVLQYSLPVSLAAAFAIGTGYSDQLVLSKFLSPEDFALYSFGCLLIPPLLIFEQSVNRVLIPRMSKSFATKNDQQAMMLYQDGISELAWIHIPAAVGLILFAEPIVELLFTSKYLASSQFLRIYALNYIINHLPYDTVARARGKGKWILKQLSAFSMISLGLVLLATYMWGARGALIASVSANFLMKTSALYQVHRQEKWPISQMLPLNDWFRYSLATALSVAAAYLTLQFTHTRLQWLLFGGVAFSVVYCGLTLKFFWSRRKLQLFAEV